MVSITTLKRIALTLIALYLLHMMCSSVEYFTVKDPILDIIRDELSVLDPRFKNVEIYEGDKSYTINKKKVYICLKDSDGRYYNKNFLVYVVCHEYAHMCCDEIGHTGKFFSIFDDILQKAERHGIYDSSIPPLEDYCGHK